ncbi:M28 family peptidase [Microbacterium sp. zg.B48]|uniref:M28 family peptidase n=1 Tax=unclassified Microbacterium TaxID=2609290 RepID=UPI00214C77E7|nr:MULTISPECIES: M28 family peptidase [unclassified Microbacterium]MCR2764092.1 M28 family peptidase [Microbacterium sp. zg.B48]MCR2809026.1 M28 family peptidase [Microbacterium sp. zg.B185]WIM18564.1 M28 family peptidase [Microbacterium sp. zg-B185]
MTDIRDIIGDIWLSRDLPADLAAICDTGGRVAGTASEAAAQQYLESRARELGGEYAEQTFTVSGLRSEGHTVRVSATGRELESYPLLNCAPVDATVPVIDLGRGTPADFEGARELIPGHAVLVRHEFPFSTNHVHRSVKLALAREYGATAFLIGNNQPGAGAVSGSGGTGESGEIPAFGLSRDATLELSTSLAFGPVEVHLVNHAVAGEWTGRNIFVRFPGRTDEVVVLSAHIDGHGLAESAMDNGAGLATVLEVARRLGPRAADSERGLLLALFTFEEWALTGSAEYVASLNEAGRRRIRCNVNVDTPVGFPRLFGLTAGDPLILGLLRRASQIGGTPVHPVYAHTTNSDHANFLAAGIPAVRLIGGYNDESADSRLLLTAADTRHRVEPLDLKHGAIVTALVTLTAMQD